MIQPVLLMTKQPTLFFGDAGDMEAIKPIGVKHIITSPPYNIAGGFGGSIPNGVVYGNNTDDMEENQYQDWQVELLNRWYDVVADGGSLFYNHRTRIKEGNIIHPIVWLLRSVWNVRQEIIWDRGSSHNNQPLYFNAVDQRIYWLTKGKPDLPEGGVNFPSVLRFAFKVNTWHPAPFPPELVRYCIQAVAVEGDIILDPFMGSCTTALVAAEFGLDSVGIDNCLEYLQKAVKEKGWSCRITETPEQRRRYTNSGSNSL